MWVVKLCHRIARAGEVQGLAIGEEGKPVFTEELDG